MMAKDGRYYRDFREHLKALEERGKLILIKPEINKKTLTIQVKLIVLPQNIFKPFQK